MNNIVNPQNHDERKAMNWPPNPFLKLRPLSPLEVKSIRGETFVKLSQIVSEGGSIAIEGPGRMGKSSMLKALYQCQLELNNSAVYCDFQGDDVREVLVKALQALGKQDDISYETLPEGKAGWEMFSDRVKMLGKQPFFLFLDELDAAPGQGFSLEFACQLRYLREQNLQIVTASRQRLCEILPHTNTNPGAEWYNMLIPHIIQPLNVEETARLLAFYLPQEVYQQAFPSKTRQYLLELTGGYPFKLMRAAYRLYDELAGLTDTQAGEWEMLYVHDVKAYN